MELWRAVAALGVPVRPAAHQGGAQRDVRQFLLWRVAGPQHDLAQPRRAPAGAIQSVGVRQVGLGHLDAEDEGVDGAQVRPQVDVVRFLDQSAG